MPDKNELKKRLIFPGKISLEFLRKAINEEAGSHYTFLIDRISDDIEIEANFPLLRGYHPASEYKIRVLKYPPAEEKGKIGTITKTVWTLWKDQPERIWRILHRWSLQNENVKIVGNNILEHGIYHGYVTPDAAFDRLWEWLLSDDGENQEAASALLTAIPGHYLFETSGRWVELSKDERRTKLVAMLIRLFIIDNKRTLQIFTSWAGKHPGAFDDVIENTLKNVPVLNEQDPEYYRSLDIQLRLLMEKFDKQSSVWLAADKLCKNARKLRSKAKNWQKRTDHAAQLSKSSDPRLYSKSMRRRKT